MATDEPDGLDEAFACHDIRQKGDQWDRDTVIVDDELHDLFLRVPAGVLLEVFLDTCHSGTGLKDLEEIMQAQLLGRRPRFLPAPTRAGLAQTRAIRAVAPPHTVDRKALVELTKSRTTASKPVLFAACKPNQTASDATFGTVERCLHLPLPQGPQGQPDGDPHRPAARRHVRPQGRRLQPALHPRGTGQVEEGRVRAVLVGADRR